jgi:hypothetical protein
MSFQVTAAPFVLLCSKAHCALAASISLKLFVQALLLGVDRARIKVGIAQARQATTPAAAITIDSFFVMGSVLI